MNSGYSKSSTRSMSVESRTRNWDKACHHLFATTTLSLKSRIADRLTTLSLQGSLTTEMPSEVEQGRGHWQVQVLANLTAMTHLMPRKQEVERERHNVDAHRRDSMDSIPPLFADAVRNRCGSMMRPRIETEANGKHRDSTGKAHWP
jgi:hypothetical protein